MEINSVNLPKEIPVTQNEVKVNTSQKEEKFANSLNKILKDGSDTSKESSSSASLPDDLDSSKVDFEKLKDYLKDEDPGLSEDEKKLLLYLVQNLQKPFQFNETKKKGIDDENSDALPNITSNPKITSKEEESKDSLVKDIIKLLQKANSEEKSLKAPIKNPIIKPIIIDDGRFLKSKIAPTINNGILATKEVSNESIKNELANYLKTNESTKNSTTLEEELINFLKEKVNTSKDSDVNSTSFRKLEIVSSIRNITKNSKEINSIEAPNDSSKNKDSYSLKPDLKESFALSDENILKQDSKLNLKEDKILKSFIKEDDSNTTKVNSLPFKLAYGEKTISVNKVETPVINKNTLVNDIVKSVKYMDNEGIKNLTVKINPKELGEVIIKISMQDGNIKATINASSKEGYNLLSQNFSELNQKLVDSNLKIQSFDLGQYQNGASLFNEGGSNENPNKSKNFKRDSNLRIEKDEDLGENEDNPNNLNIFV